MYRLITCSVVTRKIPDSVKRLKTQISRHLKTLIHNFKSHCRCFMYRNVHFTYVTSSSVFMEEAGSDDEGEASCMYTCRANQNPPIVRPNLIFPVSLNNHRSEAKVAFPCRRAKRALQTSSIDQLDQNVKMAPIRDGDHVTLN